jgi:hypothetical protein
LLKQKSLVKINPNSTVNDAKENQKSNNKVRFDKQNLKECRTRSARFACFCIVNIGVCILLVIGIAALAALIVVSDPPVSTNSTNITNTKWQNVSNVSTSSNRVGMVDNFMCPKKWPIHYGSMVYGMESYILYNTSFKIYLFYYKLQKLSSVV